MVRNFWESGWKQKPIKLTWRPAWHMTIYDKRSCNEKMSDTTVTKRTPWNFWKSSDYHRLDMVRNFWESGWKQKPIKLTWRPAWHMTIYDKRSCNENVWYNSNKKNTLKLLKLLAIGKAWKFVSLIPWRWGPLCSAAAPQPSMSKPRKRQHLGSIRKKSSSSKKHLNILHL